MACSKVCANVCPNLKRGYCSWVECPHEHNVFAFGNGAFNLTHRNVLWCTLGKSRGFTLFKEKIGLAIGKYTRVDFVDMPGTPEQGGAYRCAVVFFDSITQEARDKLFSGDCIWINHGSLHSLFRKQVRFTLFRGEVMSEETIRAKQMAKEASIQAQKASSSVIDQLAWLPFEVNTEKEVWDGAMDWSTP